MVLTGQGLFASIFSKGNRLIWIAAAVVVIIVVAVLILKKRK